MTITLLELSTWINCPFSDPMGYKNISGWRRRLQRVSVHRSETWLHLQAGVCSGKGSSFV